eukprot:scaffold549_cov117-Isochrysis_galbana.AAC.6
MARQEPKGWRPRQRDRVTKGAVGAAGLQAGVRAPGTSRRAGARRGGRRSPVGRRGCRHALPPVAREKRATCSGSRRARGARQSGQRVRWRWRAAPRRSGPLPPRAPHDTRGTCQRPGARRPFPREPTGTSRAAQTAPGARAMPGGERWPRGPSVDAAAACLAGSCLQPLQGTLVASRQTLQPGAPRRVPGRARARRRGAPAAHRPPPIAAVPAALGVYPRPSSLAELSQLSFLPGTRPRPSPLRSRVDDPSVGHLVCPAGLQGRSEDRRRHLASCPRVSSRCCVPIFWLARSTAECAAIARSALGAGVRQTEADVAGAR